jgi:hypothetical protein
LAKNEIPKFQSKGTEEKEVDRGFNMKNIERTLRGPFPVSF